MPEPRDPPPTDEGWYALHDFRTIDWDAWRNASTRDRERALGEATEFLEDALAVADTDEGDSAVYSVLGHKADLLVVHLRPTSADIGALERQFETTDFAGFTERTTSFVSVTEASGYSERARDYFEGDLDENSGLANYIQTRLKPTIPDATHVCFYPMDKRRQPEQNWYDLSFEERAEHMEAHGDIGRKYGGKVVQMITGAIALDDWEWGVTLWGDDLVDMKDLLYEMRFDPSTSRYAEFGSFYIGRRFPPSDLAALLAGEAVPTDEDHEGGVDASGPVHPETATQERGDSGHGGHGETDHAADEATDHTEADSDEGTDSPFGGPPQTGDSDVETKEDERMATRLGTLSFHEGEEYEVGDYGLALYSSADAQELADEVGDLRESFDHYDTHVATEVRANQGQSVVVSIWENERAADTALGFLTDLPDITESFRGQLGEAGDGGSGDGSAHDGHSTSSSESIRDELSDLGIYAGQPHGEDTYALVLYSTADLETLQAETEELSDGFDRYDTHEGTSVYTDPDSETGAVVSLWETADAANTASEYLSELPEIAGWADETDGFGTMGMFYTVKPEYQDDFVEKFATVEELLDGMDGHRETALLHNMDDENDMFIASQWDSKDDAMNFFRSDAFGDTVDWGRDVLADKPRHVFLA
jgi:chlorite dismutase/heme-degrading monooxygenase HmoA